ncbi:MAG: peptidoglycan DD-metalloendopeptidase family protein [Patescibacteria group bacterium]
MMLKQIQKQTKTLIILLILGMLWAMPMPFVYAADEATDELQAQLKAQRDAIEALQNKVKAYEDKVRAKRNEALNIKNQLEEIGDNIEKTETELEIKQRQITEVNLGIKEAEKRIDDKLKEMNTEQERLGEFVRILYQKGEKSYLEIILANDALSEYFDQMQYLETVQGDLAVVVKKIKAVKEKMEADKLALQEQHKSLETLSEQLDEKKETLAEKATIKNVLLETTQADEAKFQILLKEVRSEQAKINGDIVALEKKLRERLAAKGDKTLSELSGQGFIWPVESRTVTSGFHDPDYPFRRYFEHPAIDIRAKQGTAIKAIGSGYVSRALDAGMGYSYISVIHADGLSSVYGHISCILVKEDEYVVQGQVIGCSGATPGTPGAGRLTTGAHLHLEVRLNGIPVNPLDYL